MIIELFALCAEKNLNHVIRILFFVVKNAMEFREEKIKQKYVLFVEMNFNGNIINRYIVATAARIKLKSILCGTIKFLEKNQNPINVFENY